MTSRNRLGVVLVNFLSITITDAPPASQALLSGGFMLREAGNGDGGGQNGYGQQADLAELACSKWFQNRPFVQILGAQCVSDDVSSMCHATVPGIARG